MEQAATVILHVAGGSLGLMSGYAALWFAKGEHAHRVAGTVFFVFMLIMAGTGAFMAALIPERASVLAGAFTFYLVASSWATVKRREGQVGNFEVLALAWAICCAAGGFLFAWSADQSPNGLLDGSPSGPVYVFSSIALIAVVGDLNMLNQGGLRNAARIARHLWRMCTALLIAAISFFFGQQDEFPSPVRGSPILFLPPAIAFLAMVYWLVAIRVVRKWRAHAG